MRRVLPVHSPLLLECLAYLQIGAPEVELWVDELHPVLQAVDLA